MSISRQSYYICIMSTLYVSGIIRVFLQKRERYRETEREQVNGYLSLVLVGMCMTREFEHTRKMTF